MKALYKKSELGFALAWIGIYCVLMSLGDSLSAKAGVQNAVTLPIALMLCLLMIAFVKKNGLYQKYGLCKPSVPMKKMLFYLPLLALFTVNLWYGLSLDYSLAETVLYISTMLCVGFLEEIIFRGLLFKAIFNDNLKAAIAISSISFGMGHIIRLFNGSGAELLENLLQVLYAMAAGFMFVMIFYKSESLFFCIIGHGVFNALSVFSNDEALTLSNRVASCVFLVIISTLYGLYLALRINKKEQIKA